MKKIIKTSYMILLIVGFILLSSCFNGLDSTDDKKTGEVEKPNEEVDKNEDDTTKPHVHIESSWNVVEEATCQKEGKKEIFCVECQEVLEEDTIDKVEHAYVNNKCTMCGKEKIYPTGVPYIENERTYINLGKYPQTVVDDEILINELNKITTTNNLGYIEYNGNEYKKQLANPISNSNAFPNGDIIIKDQIYYFKVEPIKWRLLEETAEGYKLLSENILDIHSYYIPTQNRKINGKMVDNNNYEYSDIRAWLNGYDGTSYGVEDYTGIGFLDIAFTKEEQKIIKTTLVDNSVESTKDTTNPHKYNNTNDKIYLLSYKDVTNSSYGFKAVGEDVQKQAAVTDYALARGCSAFNNRIGSWWLRSPFNTNSEYSWFIMPSGMFGFCIVDMKNGVRPGLEITA